MVWVLRVRLNGGFMGDGGSSVAQEKEKKKIKMS